MPYFSCQLPTLTDHERPQGQRGLRRALVIALLAPDARQRLLRLTTRHPCQILSHDIDDKGRDHQQHADPEVPVMMQAFPVVATSVMRLSVLLVVRHLIHGYSWNFCFRISSRLMSGN